MGVSSHPGRAPRIATLIPGGLVAVLVGAALITVAVWLAAIIICIVIAGAFGPVDMFRNTSKPVQLSRTTCVVVWPRVASIGRAVAVSCVFKEEIGAVAAILPIVAVNGARALLKRSITATKVNASIRAFIHVDVLPTASVVGGHISATLPGSGRC
eukprot:1840-Prymnesium_polylepis.1